MTHSTAASSSSWVWNSTHGLFYDPTRLLWARYEAETGEYVYLPASSASAAPAASGADDLDGLPYEVEEGEIEEHWGACYRDDGEVLDESKPATSSSASLPSSSSSAATSKPPIRKQLDYSDSSLYAFSTPRSPSPNLSAAFSTLRLLKLFSSCLPTAQTLAILSSDQTDGYTIGRDKQLGEREGRIRLREFEVSRIHGTIYFEGGTAGEEEGGGAGWWIVDQGSTHGTFLCKAADAKGGGKEKGKGKGKRLCKPKKSGLPVKLEHGDHLTVGTTLFEVHIHTNLPCDLCTLSCTSSLIPTSLAPPSTATSADDPSSSWSSTVQREASLNPPLSSNEMTKKESSKESLKRLREKLLSDDAGGGAGGQKRAKKAEQPSFGTSDPSSLSSSSSASSASSVSYTDRAALRRSVHPNLAPIPPLQTSRPNPSIHKPPMPPPSSSPSSSYSSSISTPLPSSNIGHSLLLKQGWKQGSALGSLPSASAEPLVVRRPAGEGRKGLGAKIEPSRVEGVIGGGGGGGDERDWRTVAKERRWKDFAAGGGG